MVSIPFFGDKTISLSPGHGFFIVCLLSWPEKTTLVGHVAMETSPKGMVYSTYKVVPR